MYSSAWQAHILFIVLPLYPVYAGAVNFAQCFSDLTSCANSTGCAMNISNTTALSMLLTSNGSFAASVDVATALSYPACTKYCGSGQQPFSWSVFSQEYSAWLLPYLALLSQLPFGAQRRMDNLMSAILTLGSPTLAGYSLYMTFLNARWVNDYLFLGIDYPSATVRQSVVQVLSSLQQVPLRVHPGESARFESLVVHPDNDQWWTAFAEDLDYTRTWSIASATSITWVFIAYLLTVADSMSNVAQNIDSNGQGTGSGWLWLLPIVAGWLILSPKCDHDRVHSAYDKANRQVFVTGSCDPAATPTHVTSNFGLTISPRPDRVSRDGHVTSPDELLMPPIFNYARVFSWARNAHLASLYYRTAWLKTNHRIGVDNKHINKNIRDDVPRESRLGTRDQIIRYCRPDNQSANILWPRGLFFNMIVASLMSLQLQWGTTGAAILVVWFTPTIGLGCRSLAYLVYGTLSTAVWLLLVSSSLLGYYAHHLADDIPPFDPERAERYKAFGPTGNLRDDDIGLVATVNRTAIPMHILRDDDNVAAEDVASLDTEPASISTIKHLHTGWAHARALSWLADWLRWIGKLVAIFNAIGVIANSVFQYAGVYDTCYCDSSVLSWGANAFNVVNPVQGDIDLAWKAWVGALALSLSCSAFFIGSMYLIRDSLPV